ncbi:MAG: NAD(P)/FAD-dependent oxidoreductase [Candidatus Pacearchaeota archaeon]|jgi:protoporphyrinogen oxidase
MKQKKVVIMGAGPAGLTAAYTLSKGGINPTIIERDKVVGGIARTVKYKKYRFDIGGHRFFTKSREIEDLWLEILGKDLLTRPRLSRWYFQKKFFDYPIKPLQVIKIFGLDSVKFTLSYAKSRIFPIKPEISAEDWYKNQFGEALAKPFFIKYNEKLWGIPCNQLSMDFGKQRVRGVSFLGTVVYHLKRKFGSGGKEVASLIDQFYYPKYGPGMMWDKFKENIEKDDGRFIMEKEVVKIKHKNHKITSIIVKDKKGKSTSIKAEHFLSSLPLKELIKRLDPQPPREVLDAADSLKFRAFVTVALIINKENLFPDTWIYTHDPEMRCIRIQNFNNWSPYMVGEEGKTCLGFEYTCDFDDGFWNLDEETLKKLAVRDLEQTGFAKKEEVIDAKVMKLKEVYPVYDLGYGDRVEIIKKYIEETFNKEEVNIQPIGRGGMHKYNNMDHSMMTGLLAAKNLIGGEKFDAWKVNIEAEYHEEKK